jgi:hypothetical protein
MSEPDPLPLRWGLILLAALVIGLVVGLLTFATSGLWPAALLAALTVAGVAVPALHRILGPGEDRTRR